MKKIFHSIAYVSFMTIILCAPQVWGGAKIQIDDTKSWNIGAGMRASYAAIEDNAPNGQDWSSDFVTDNMRLYMNGQLSEYIKMEFNTDCTNCMGSNSSGTMIVLDAIAKFEFSPYFNVWAGRLLTPSDRAELDGPYYQNTYEFNKTPFYPQDYGNPGAGLGSPSAGNGAAAGRFGRDDGINIWGALLDDKRLTYVVGIADGLDGLANRDGSPLWAGRFTFNFLEIEKNPGYYTSSTYYGNGGDIFTVAFAIQHQAGGAGSQTDPGNFTGWSTDALYERVLSDKSVVTLEGEFKHFDADLGATALTEGNDCFCIFEGHAWTATGLYLLPSKIGMGPLKGQLQPYFRVTENVPENSPARDEAEFGVNYVIDGHNARVSLFYQYGDIATKGRSYLPTTTGDEVGAIKLAVQLQL